MGSTLTATVGEAGPGRQRRVRIVRWLVAIVVAFLVHGAALVVFDLPRRETPALPGRLAPITFLSTDREGQGQLLKEQLEFADTAPLYFPTRWNVANAENIRLPLKSPGDIFPSYPPRLLGSDLSAGGLVQLPELAISSPVGALASFKPDYTRVAGQVDRVVVVPEPRVAMVEVFDLRSGRKVSETTVGESGDGSLQLDVVWRPAEWMVLVDAVGQVGEAMMTRSSGSDLVDATLGDLVNEGLDLDKRLDPGYYSVQIGP
ncbi:MAG: hypothetical protein R3F07_10080 [Opitutaceae bacterium]